MADTCGRGWNGGSRPELTGEVRFDRFTRGRYATDASHYQMMPVGVVAPRTMDEAERAIAIAREEGVTVLPRGGGTSQCGQTVNQSLVVDCSKYLNRILELDVAGRRCVVEPGIVLDDLNRALKPHGLWFPVDISTASRATIGGMAGNNSCGARSLRYGNTRENVISIDAMLADGTHAHFGPVVAELCRISAGIAAARARVAICSRIGAREADEIAARFPKVQRRVGGYNLDALLPGRNDLNLAHILVGSEGTLGFSTQIELKLVAAARPPRGRRLPFRQLLRGDGCRAAYREARADRGRAGRPHHDRARARDRDVPADARAIRARRCRRRSCWSNSARTITTRICAG